MTNSAQRTVLPFQGMKPEAWMRLGIAALAVCYLLQIGFELAWRNTCGHLAIDYCALWSAGRVANTLGYARVYDLRALAEVEAGITPSSAAYGFVVSPIAYLPIFLIPFQLLAKLDPGVSYWLWAIGNLLALALYLRFFIQKTTGMPMRKLLLALSLLSLPVYWNLFNGQVNVWLVMCVGETLRAALAGQTFRAGLWLGGLLLKPQLLVLIVPILLLQRAFRMIAGLAASGLALIAASWLMIGSEGLASLAALWLGFGTGMPTNDIAIMMNWRMLGNVAGSAGSPLLAGIISIAGLAATLIATLYLWRRRVGFGSSSAMMAWIGLLAATTVFTWHSHVHMAMILLPPLLYVAMNTMLPERTFAVWVMLPAVLYFAAFIAGALMQAGMLPAVTAELANLGRGAGEFGMSLYLLVWAIRQQYAPKATIVPEAAS